MPSVTLPGGISFSVGEHDWTSFIQTSSIRKELKLLVLKSPDSGDAWQKLADKLTDQITNEQGVDPKIDYRYIQSDSLNMIVFTALYTRYQQYSKKEGSDEVTADNIFYDEKTYNEYKAFLDDILSQITITPIDPFA